MSKPLIRLLGQGVRYASKLRGGGSAFPGLVMEKLHPEFVAEELAKLPYGVVVVSGTNGKTTTTKMTVQLLESQGLKVFTNRTGSHFVRGAAGKHGKRVGGRRLKSRRLWRRQGKRDMKRSRSYRNAPRRKHQAGWNLPCIRSALCSRAYYFCHLCYCWCGSNLVGRDYFGWRRCYLPHGGLCALGIHCTRCVTTRKKTR